MNNKLTSITTSGCTIFLFVLKVHQFLVNEIDFLEYFFHVFQNHNF